MDPENQNLTRQEKKRNHHQNSPNGLRESMMIYLQVGTIKRKEIYETGIIGVYRLQLQMSSIKGKALGSSRSVFTE